jgi:CheY-like chemotaxis protein
MTLEPSTGRPDLSRITALVVDNDQASIDLLNACLQPFGARIVSARSASQAKQMIDSMIPDVLICDLALPDHDGLEFMLWLRARSAEQGGRIPAVAVTFFYERFGVRDTRAAGFDMFIRKPIDPMAIVQAVSLLVTRRPEPS